MNETIISIDELSAGYGRGRRRVQALENVTLSIERGEIFGLLGPNGAGKTTLLSCIEGIHQPAAGCVSIDGVDVERQPHAAQQLLGIQLQHTALLDDLTVAELITELEAAQAREAELAVLREREHDVLVLLAQGHSNREIAESLVITEGTVKNHVSNILGKLQAENRTQAASIARKHGLL